MVWFKGLLRSQPVKVDFAISQTPRAVSDPCAFVPGYLLEMAFLAPAPGGKRRHAALSPSQTQSGAASACPQVALNIGAVLLCVHCALSILGTRQHLPHRVTVAASTPASPGGQERDTDCASVPTLSLRPAPSALSGDSG